MGDYNDSFMRNGANVQGRVKNQNQNRADVLEAKAVFYY